MIDSKLMENDTESPREGTSSFIFVFLTLGDRTVYNIDSKQFYCDKSEFNCERGGAYENDNNKNESKE